MKYPIEQKEFERDLVKEYFRCGSVEESFRQNKFNFPVSYPTYQRILDRWRVVKNVGSVNKLSEAVEFLSHFAHDNLSFEEIYKKIPLRYQTSITTLYRILSYVKEGLTRRIGVGLVITPYNDQRKVLVAKDISIPRIELGKVFGSLSLPMGYAKKRDSRKSNILRILQQEVFTKKVIDQTFPEELILKEDDPFMYLDIVDVRVAIYHIQLSKYLSNPINFSSFKLRDYKFISIDSISHQKENFRVGVKEAIAGYRRYLTLLDRKLTANPFQAQSFLNRDLACVTVKINMD